MHGGSHRYMGMFFGRGPRQGTALSNALIKIEKSHNPHYNSTCDWCDPVANSLHSVFPPRMPAIQATELLTTHSNKKAKTCFLSIMFCCQLGTHPV